jgi:hypothetical protein
MEFKYTGMNAYNRVTYDGSKYGIMIQYPENWNITEDTSGVWFISPVDESGNIRITSEPSQNLSLADLVQIQNLQTKSSNKDLNIVSSNMTTIDGTPANRTDYKFKAEFPKFLGKVKWIDRINNFSDNLWEMWFFW